MQTDHFFGVRPVTERNVSSWEGLPYVLLGWREGPLPGAGFRPGLLDAKGICQLAWEICPFVGRDCVGAPPVVQLR